MVIANKASSRISYRTDRQFHHWYPPIGKLFSGGRHEPETERIGPAFPEKKVPVYVNTQMIVGGR